MGEGAGIAQQVLKLSGEQNQRVAPVASPTGACKRHLMVDRIEGLQEASARVGRCKEGEADRIGTPMPLVNPGCRSNLGYPGRQYVLRVKRDGPPDEPRAGRPGRRARGG
jgi:hypothetical protein